MKNTIKINNVVKYVILLMVVATSTFYIPNCSIINEHAFYIGLLAATTFALLDRYMPHIVVVEAKKDTRY